MNPFGTYRIHILFLLFNGSKTHSSKHKRSDSFQDLASPHYNSSFNGVVSSIGVREKPRPYYFCGVKNNQTNSRISKRYVLQGSKWKKFDLTWAITIESTRHEIREIALREFIKATELWSKASKLTFRRVSRDDPNIDILVHFVKGDHKDGWNFDGEGGTLAHAFYPGTTLNGDVHFDDTESFISHADILSGKDGVDLFVVAAHELGHSIGLYHSNSETALMAPFYQPMTEDSKLPDDDQRAIQILYGRRDDDTSIPRFPTARPPDTPPYVPPSTSTSTTPRPRWTTPSWQWSTPRPQGSTPRQTWTPSLSTTTTPRSPPTTHWTYNPPHTYPSTSPSTTTEFTPVYSSCDLSPPSENALDICKAKFDAAFHLTETFFFSGEYMWRIWYEKKQISQSKIYDSLDVFRKNDIRRVDAACISNREILFFSGKNITKLIGTNSEVMTLESIGIKNIDKVDAAWTWGHNGYTYIMSGEHYWRLNSTGFVEPDYPRSASVWQGLPKSIGAALTMDDLTYFFAGDIFYTFSNLDMRAAAQPMLTAPYWLGCPHPDFKEVVYCSSGLEAQLCYFSVLFYPCMVQIYAYFLNLRNG